MDKEMASHRGIQRIFPITHGGRLIHILETVDKLSRILIADCLANAGKIQICLPKQSGGLTEPVLPEYLRKRLSQFLPKHAAQIGFIIVETMCQTV